MLKRILKIFVILIIVIVLLPPLMWSMTYLFLSVGSDPSYQGPEERDPALLEYYDYPKSTIDADIRIVRESDGFALSDVQFPEARRIGEIGRDTVEIDYYEQKGEGRFPTVVLLPITGGIEFDPSTRNIAGYFAHNGFNCAILHGEKIDEDSVGSAQYVEDYLRQSVIDSRQILDFLEGRKKIDSDRLAIFGISLGGIEASVIMGVDGRIRCGVIALAGGTLADIICESRSSLFRKARERVMDAEGIDLQQLYSELEDTVITDPVRLAPYIDAENVLMISAMFDMVIPRDCSSRLWNEMGRPARFLTLTEHYSAGIYIPYAEGRSVTFFREKLDVEQ